MSGIVVGIDGSGHSERALESAMREAEMGSVSSQVSHQAPCPVVVIPAGER